MERIFNRGSICRILVIGILVAGILAVCAGDSFAAVYRVYFARPTTPAPTWDWAQTVVASNKDMALGRAYADWKESRPGYTVPPLKDCRQNVRSITGMP